jgi:PAS domain S-box-containing protein
MDREGMFRELVENSSDIVIVTNREYNIRYISSSVRSLFGLEPVALLGRNIFDYVRPTRKDVWLKCLEEQSQFTGEETIKFNDQILYFDVNVSNLLNNYTVQGLVLKLHDITEKKNREDELMRSNRQLDQIIFKTIHDLKAPLMSALGLVNLAERANSDDQTKYLSLVRKSLQNLDSLIEEMNDFFRNDKTAVQREKMDVNDLVQTEVSNVKNLLEANGISVASEVHIEGDFYSDAVRVRSIVSNILSNAIKYYDPRKKAPSVNITILINQDICIIKLTDNGIGIEQQYQEKIFDLFFRATDQSQGTGLGLFIVKDTIVKLKGEIEVESEPGRGTTFTIKIPNQIFQPATVD